MKIQLPDQCPVCGAESYRKGRYKCGLYIYIWDVSTIKYFGKCADKVLIKFGTTEQTGNEESDNA
jgi:hypothetical protein